MEKPNFYCINFIEYHGALKKFQPSDCKEQCNNCMDEIIDHHFNKKDNHKSMSFKSENGIEATVLGSENMSNETKNMLSKVVEKAYLIDSNPELEKFPCHACQGGGCPVCSGFGYYYAN